MGGKTLGIQIKDNGIRFALLGAKASIHALQTIPLPHGVIVDGRIQRPDDVSEALNTFMRSIGRAEAVICMPNSRMYTMNIWVQSGLGEDEFRKVFMEAASKRLPIDAADSVLSIEESAHVNDHLVLDVYMAERRDTGALQKALKAPRVNLHAIEMQAASVYRAILHYGSAIAALKENQLAVLLELDGDWPTISLFDHFGSLFFSRSIPLDAIRTANNISTSSDIISADMMQVIEGSLVRIVNQYRSAGYEIPRIYLAGDAGATNPIHITSIKQLSLQAFPIIERLAIPSISPEDVLPYLSAIGAGLRPRIETKQSRRHNLLHPF